MVTVLNINAGNNAEILGSCKTLREYMLYTEKVRGYAMQMPIEQAVERTITECIKEDILAEFLKKNRAEAMEVSIFEYNEELHLANLRREGYEDGLEAIILKQTDVKVLNGWVKIAAKCTKIEEFEEGLKGNL